MSYRTYLNNNNNNSMIAPKYLNVSTILSGSLFIYISDVNLSSELILIYIYIYSVYHRCPIGHI